MGQRKIGGGGGELPLQFVLDGGGGQTDAEMTFDATFLAAAHRLDRQVFLTHPEGIGPGFGRFFALDDDHRVGGAIFPRQALDGFFLLGAAADSAVQEPAGDRTAIRIDQQTERDAGERRGNQECRGRRSG